MNQRTTTISIKDLAQWGPPEQVSTARGLRILRKADPKTARATNLSDLVKDTECLSWRKDDAGNWLLCWWQTPEEAQLAQAAAAERAAKAAVIASRAATTNFVPPAPEGCEYMPFQRAGIEFALQRSGTLIGDSPGLGKSQPGYWSFPPGCSRHLSSNVQRRIINTMLS